MDAAAWNGRDDTSELIWKGEPNQFLPPEVVALTPGASLASENSVEVEWVVVGGERTAIDTLVGVRRVA